MLDLIRRILAVVILLSVQLSSQADEIDFETQVRPILESKCLECHGAKVREGGLRFTSRSDALLETDSAEFAIVPGDVENSGLLHRVTSRDESDQMPPEGERLSDKEIQVLRQWILEGATWPETPEQKHWSYVAPRRPEVPAVSNADWPQNEIDNFVLAKLESNALSPSESASAARLLRRVSLALTGLPPTIEQVDEFAKNPTIEAYEKFVDQCLESPNYGERWAQPWLDLARYADSNGFQADQLRDSWAYRDWVIGAINRDMPYDQFTIEQLAGDLLPDATLDQKIATGFHRTVTCNVEAGVHPEENRVNQIFDRVNTTGTVFLGTTIECCQCHNHKYDPFTQDEYYQLFSYFNNTPLEVKLESGVQYNFYGPKVSLPLEPGDQARFDSLTEDLETAKNELRQLNKSAAEDRAKLKSRLVELAKNETKWVPLSISSFESTGGESHQVLEDTSILIGGSVPGTTVYKLNGTFPLDEVSAIKLEALTHSSLPGKGPGRGDVKRPNFILSELNIEHRLEESGKAQAVELISAWADYSQPRWEIEKAIDGNRTTGWAIAGEFSKDHYAVFQPKQSITNSPDNAWTFTLDQNYGRGRTLGRFRVLATNADSLALKLTKELKSALLAKKPNKKQKQAINTFLDAQNPARIGLTQKISKLQKEVAQLEPPTTLVMVEMDEARTTRKLMRGNYLDPGKTISSGVPAVLNRLAPDSPNNRLGLAQWIVSRDNPLFARVAVNRWWGLLMGRYLVESPEDFGTQASPPSHPQLLDWLATEFVENGYSTKHIHKLIVMSSTFRQSAKLNSAILQVDPKNRLYTRGPRIRMSAEMIRDNALAATGLLSNKMGGPPVMPYQPDNIWRAVGRNAPKWKASNNEDRFRRGIYVIWRRAAPYPSFVNFDAPDRAACVVKRPTTNTPLQALTLMNDQAYMEMSIGLAFRLLSKQNNNKSNLSEMPTFIKQAFRKCVARAPDESELSTLADYCNQEIKRFHDSEKSAKEFLNIGQSTISQFSNVKIASLSSQQQSELAGLAMTINVILNLDETINY